MVDTQELSLSVRGGLEAYGLEGVYRRLEWAGKVESEVIVRNLVDLNGTPINRREVEIWIRQQEAERAAKRERQMADALRYNRMRTAFVGWMIVSAVMALTIMIHHHPLVR